MPTHNRFELTLSSMTVTLNLDNVIIGKHRTKEHRGNTCECGDKHLTFECNDIGIENGMYNYLIVNTKYNSLAIRISLWIVFRTSYTYATLHLLVDNEYKIMYNRLDGRGVTNRRAAQHLEVRIQSEWTEKVLMTWWE